MGAQLTKDTSYIISHLFALSSSLLMFSFSSRIRSVSWTSRSRSAATTISINNDRDPFSEAEACLRKVRESIAESFVSLSVASEQRILEEKETPNRSSMVFGNFMWLAGRKSFEAIQKLRFHNLEASQQKSELHIVASLDLSTKVLIFSILEYQNGLGLELTHGMMVLPYYALSTEHWKAFFGNAIVPWPQRCVVGDVFNM